VCIALGTADSGVIYFWDHEREAPEGHPPTYQNLHRVAANFTDFLQRLELEAPISHAASGVEHACEEANIDQVRAYLRSGGDANYVDQQGHSLAWTATLHGHLAILQLLHKAGADIRGLVTIAAQHGYARIVEYLLSEGGEIDEILDNRRDTPLMKAATFGQREVVEVLLQHGANVQAKNKFGQTALVRAIWGDHKEVVELLQQAGAQ
jgi:ankyrin repeat protein